MFQKKNEIDNKVRIPRDVIPPRVSIIGAARSGISAARVLSQRGSKVFISDTCGTKKLDLLLASNGLAHIAHESEGHSEKVLECDAIILSPGVRADIPVIAQAVKRGIPVWSEMELGYRLSTAPFAAVTGSSGKTTTVSMLGSICKAANLDYVVAGNIGTPVCSLAPSVGQNGVVVAEVSSFQLETIDLFKPKAAAILNMTKNHLDRYNNEDDYYEAKKAIARNMDPGDVLVLNACDQRLLSWALSVQDHTRVMFFGRETGDVDCVWHDNASIFIRRSSKVEKLMDVSGMQVKGSHNFDNASAASALAYALNIDDEAIAQGLCSFKGLEHRLEFVRELDGVKYYNDSKATTAESVACAISAFGSNVHLIAGGRDKGCDFAGIRNIVMEHVKSVHLIGEASDRIYHEWQGVTAISRERSLSAAIESARENSVPGDVVILSPGCSSFDMFKSFEDRGEVFKEIVCGLKSENGGTNE